MHFFCAHANCSLFSALLDDLLEALSVEEKRSYTILNTLRMSHLSHFFHAQGKLFQRFSAQLGSLNSHFNTELLHYYPNHTH